MTGPLARIIMRYGVGFLVGAGVLSSDVAAGLASDPDVVAIIEWGLIGSSVALVEGWYLLARKMGWRL